MKKYLLEHYPIIWSSKLVSMLALALAGHLLFFVLGFTTDEKDGFFPLPFLLHLIISILLLVFWLLQLSKNNAIKHFYPSSTQKLIGEFALYFAIVFAVSSFYISFMSGQGVYLFLLKQDNVILSIEELNNLIQVLSLVSLFISLLALCARLTDMRTLLITIVFSGVTWLLLGFVSVIIMGLNLYIPVFWLYSLTPFIVTLIVATNLKTMPKLFSGILINFSLLFFTPALYGIFFLIFEVKFSDLTLVNYIILAVNFIFIYLYAPTLFQWKATPE